MYMNQYYSLMYGLYLACKCLLSSTHLRDRVLLMQHVVEYECASLYVCVFVELCVCMCLGVFCTYFYVYGVCVCVCLFCTYLYVHVCFCVFCTYLYVYVCVYLCVCVCAFCTYLYVQCVCVFECAWKTLPYLLK